MTYSPLAAFLSSFYSARFYRHVAARWRSVSLAYLLLVLAFFWTPGFLKMHWLLTRVLQGVQTDVIPKIPTLRFESGQFSTVEKKAYFLKFGSAAVPIDIIVDTTGGTTSLEGSKAFMLIARDRLLIRQRSGETRIYDLSKSTARPFVISPERIARILQPLKYWVLASLYIAIFILSFLKRLIEAFFIALIGLVLASLFKLELDLGALLSLAIVSMTPAMALETVNAFVGRPVHYLWILWPLLIGAYFIFALNAASDKAAE